MTGNSGILTDIRMAVNPGCQQGSIWSQTFIKANLFGIHMHHVWEILKPSIVRVIKSDWVMFLIFAKEISTNH